MTEIATPTEPSRRSRIEVDPELLHRAAAGMVLGSADSRFHNLLGPDAWSRLPEVVRARFSKRLQPGRARLYHGEVIETRLSRAGRILARLAVVAGSPLPDIDGATGPATVSVVEDPALGGQVWTRTYTRPGRFPQTVNSVKRFAGPTGLEEYLGAGLVMRLVLSGDGGDLVFRSAGYDLLIGGRRLPLPRWASPGTCTIRHRVLDARRFAFVLLLEHPYLGRLVTQTAYFEEVSQ